MYFKELIVNLLILFFPGNQHPEVLYLWLPYKNIDSYTVMNVCDQVGDRKWEALGNLCEIMKESY